MEEGQKTGEAVLEEQKILYLFSGSHRQTSFANSVERLAREAGLKITVVEVDIEFGEEHDLSKHDVRQRWLRRISSGEFRAVVITPPCSTYSRVRMANMKGPPPLRSRSFPYGFPWLSNHHKKQASLGTCLVDFTLDVFLAISEVKVERSGYAILAFSEHPEDLGAVCREEDGLWMEPASMWQRPEWSRVLEEAEGMFTVVYNQCCWGAAYRKPTRSVTNLQELRTWGPNEWPSFDDHRMYLGPEIQCSCRPQRSLVKKHNYQTFETTGPGAYPPAMDLALATAFVTAIRATATLPSCQSGREQGEEASVAEEVEVPAPGSEATVGPDTCQSDRCCSGSPVVSDRSQEVSGNAPGVGRAMRAYYKGKHRSVHDGGGLCSPGRWPPSRRKPLEGINGLKLAAKVKKLFLSWVLEVEKRNKGGVKDLFWRLAGGKHPSSPFGESMERMREELDSELEAMGFSPRRKSGDRSTEIHFRRLIAMLKAVQDEDIEFLEPMVSEGVPLGVDEEMPRTPRVFEEKTKWAREFADYVLEEQTAENYGSAEENQEDIRRQVMEELEIGSIRRYEDEEAKAKFKGRLAVAALGAVPKELGSDRVRLIHDGTYSVDINRRIKVRDRMRFPLCDDAAAVLVEIEEEVRETKEARFALLYDISRAHKLIPVVQRDWGLQAFRLPGEASGHIYVHTRGTFGIASAAYYWQRTAACLVRLCHRLAGLSLGVYHLLFADDGWITSVGEHFWRKALFWLFVMELAEFPISWKKVRGGLEVQWIGYQINVDEFSRGVSSKKVRRVDEWISRRLQEGGVTGREMKAALGRLSFVSGALHHVRPFLGPVFAWAAVVGLGSFVHFPDAIKILLAFIVVQLKGCSMDPARRMPEVREEVFRIDAKAEGEKIVVGGWECYGGIPTERSRWFSVELTRRTAPWAYVKGDPFRTISSLELIAVLTAVMLLAPEAKWKGGRSVAVISATTDNLGNTFVLQKFMSCKYPLSIVVMELACQLRKHQLEMDLSWAPRMQNVPADALTNMEFELFNEELRILRSFEELEFEVLDLLMEKAGELDKEIQLAKTSKASKKKADDEEKRRGGKKRGEMKWKDPW